MSAESNSVLLVRADASARCGTGHVMRCLALGQAWMRAGGRVVFVSVNMPPALCRRLRAERMETMDLDPGIGMEGDAAETAAIGRAISAAWVVADGYGFGAAWQKQVKAAGARLMVIDDYGHAEHYHADVVLNQNLSADERLYLQRERSTRLLLGPDFALLRREFVNWRGWRRKIAATGARKVLVTMGGSDPDNATAEVVAALAGVTAVEAVVVVGGSNPNSTALDAATRGNPIVRVVKDVNDMSALMGWADVAVTAAGSTSWELAFMGLPSVVLVLAENQMAIATALAARGTIKLLGVPTTVTVEQIRSAVITLLDSAADRTRMSQNGRDLVDGFGVERILQTLSVMSNPTAEPHARVMASGNRHAGNEE